MKTLNPLSISTALILLVGLGSAQAHTPLTADAQTRALYHFNELTGTLIEDSSFSGIWDGTLLNGAGRGASLFNAGTALALDGIDDYASVAPEVLNDIPQSIITLPKKAMMLDNQRRLAQEKVECQFRQVPRRAPAEEG